MQQKYTVLVIDDDYTELDMMAKVLTRGGYRVLTAEDGETGYNSAIFAHPDLILLDVLMPGINGYETAKRLRGNRRTKNVPIFFKTCIGDKQSTIIEGFLSGVDYVIPKSCDHDGLLDLIKFQLAAIRSRNLRTHHPLI